MRVRDRFPTKARSQDTDMPDAHGGQADLRDKTYRIAFIHPDLGIGGAERLVVDAAVGLQDLGHDVEIFTSWHDPNHCFEQTRDGEARRGGAGGECSPADRWCWQQARFVCTTSRRPFPALSSRRFFSQWPSYASSRSSGSSFLRSLPFVFQALSRSSYTLT